MSTYMSDYKNPHTSKMLDMSKMAAEIASALERDAENRSRIQRLEAALKEARELYDKEKKRADALKDALEARTEKVVSEAAEQIVEAKRARIQKLSEEFAQTSRELAESLQKQVEEYESVVAKHVLADDAPPQRSEYRGSSANWKYHMSTDVIQSLIGRRAWTNISVIWSCPEFYVSYNSSVGQYGCETTAIVTNEMTRFYILNGDHQEAMGLIIKKYSGESYVTLYQNLIEYFENRREMHHKLSDCGWRAVQRRMK